MGSNSPAHQEQAQQAGARAGQPLRLLLRGAAAPVLKVQALPSVFHVPAEQVQQWKQKNPDQVNEVPVQA